MIMFQMLNHCSQTQDVNTWIDRYNQTNSSNKTPICNDVVITDYRESICFYTVKMDTVLIRWSSSIK